MAQASSERLVVRNKVFLPVIWGLMGLCLLVASILALTQPIPHADNPLLLRLATGVLGLPASLFIVFMNARKVFSRRYAVLIDERGITDNTGGLASGFTPWEEIAEVFLLKLKDDTYLCAVPVDYEAWSSHLNGRQRRLAQANLDAGFAPIRIQFKKVSERVTAQDGLATARRFQPKKITRVRKPKY